MECMTAISSSCFPVVLGMFILSCSLIGIVKVMGVLLVDMSKSLQTTSTELGTALGIFMAFCFLTGPFISALYSQYPRTRPLLMAGATMQSCATMLLAFVTSNKLLFVLFAFMGIGHSIMWLIYFILLSSLAGENFNLLFSLSSCGYPVGMVLLPLLAELLLVAYDWRGVLLILGALLSNLIPCAMIVKSYPLPAGFTSRCETERQNPAVSDGLPQCQDFERGNPSSHDDQVCPEETVFSTPVKQDESVDSDKSTLENELSPNQRPERTTDFSRIAAWLRNMEFYRNPFIIFIFLSFAIQEFVYIGWHTFVLPLAIQRGASVSHTLIIAFSAALGNLFGRISVGVLTPKLIEPIDMYLALTIFNVFALGFDGFIRNFSVMLVTSCCSGAAIAGRAVLGPLAVKKNVSSENLPSTIGALYVFGGCGALLGGYAAGMIADCLRSYGATLKLLGAVDILTFISMAMPKIVRRPDLGPDPS